MVTTIPPRAELLQQALASVQAQTRPPDRIVVECDDRGTGAMATRNRALARVRTPWVAFLDDDDTWLPRHLQVLEQAVGAHPEATLLYPWYDGPQGILAAPHRGRMYEPLRMPFDAEMRDHLILRANFVPVTVLVRTERLRRAGGFQPFPGNRPDNPCEDWGAWRALLLDGAQFVHVAEVTWRWNHHGANTSGQPVWLPTKDDACVS